MPSPVGHALGGLIVALVATPDNHEDHEGHQERQGREAARSWTSKATLRVHRVYLVTCVLAACLPDIDFAWGRHSMETHSVGFALFIGLAVFGFFRSPRLAIAALLSVGTHVLFDWLGSDDFPPLGVMAMWPFNREFYFADAYVFATISRRYWLEGFVAHNVLAVLREIAILLPLAALAYWWRRRGTV